MLTLIPILAGTALLGIGIRVIVEAHKAKAFLRYTNQLSGRIVRINEAYRKEANIGKYGKISSVDTDEYHQRINVVNIYPFITGKALTTAKKQYDTAYKQAIDQYNIQLAQYRKAVVAMKKQGINNQALLDYQNQYYSGYYGMQGIGQYSPQEPRKPAYSFSPEQYGSMRQLRRKDFKIMPKNFDVVSEQVVKQLKTKEEKGGDKEVRRMPRLFRFALYLALIYVVWDVVFNANSIAGFVVHTFILHK